MELWIWGHGAASGICDCDCLRAPMVSLLPGYLGTGWDWDEELGYGYGYGFGSGLSVGTHLYPPGK
ncbi:GM12790 [Drosophila sechellia]|uniref:GM12790 n=1 Tax=Drosophila sechellia TaxID=7238 RepID=B4HZA4_DROSE|nr:GM12790 [Drosophila sechellia]